jgi:hypothetical protein
MNGTLAVRYDPRLIEEAVFHARRNSHVLKELDEQRNRIYEVGDPDDRERRFNELYHSWFVRLGLNQTIDEALQEQPIVTAQVESCFIVRAAQSKEEGAELFVAPAPRPEESARRTARIALRPESLLDRERLLAFLRHELFHIADMLDPAFAYEPTLPKTEGGPTYDTLITNRYRVLWDVTIDGRMSRRGWLPDSAREEQLADFHGAFPMLKENVEEPFNKFFATDRPTHSELAAFAFDPRNAAGSADDPCAPGTHCPLCKFPTHAFEPQPNRLGDDVIAAIKQDFRDWKPALGLCAQCADLYRASRLSLAAAKLLPGWTPSPTPEPTDCGHERGRVAAGGK